MRAFLARFGSLIESVLSGSDRLRLVGESRLLNDASGVDSYLFQQRIRYVDFPRHAERLTEHLRRRARALNPLAGNDGELLGILAQGNFLLRRFRNADLRIALYGQASNPAERRRQSRAVTRRLALLRTHGLIVKVTRSHRYHLSTSGRRIVTTLLAAHACDVGRLASTA